MNAEIATVLLFFSGTIAFVPDSPDAKGVTAYLLNVEHHKKTLRVPLNDLKAPEIDCPSQYCEVTDRFCDCCLDGLTVSIPTLEVTGSVALPQRPPSERIDDNNKGGIDWLVAMAYVNPRYARVSPSKIAANAGANIHFNWDEAATCAFEEARCRDKTDWKRKIFYIDMDPSFFGRKNQPVPELVVFQSRVELPLKIALEKAGKVVDDLTFKCTKGPCGQAQIINSVPSTNHTTPLDNPLCNPMTCEEGSGSHFGAYSRVVRGYSLGIEPRRRCADFEMLIDEIPLICEAAKDFIPRTVGDRIICPPTALVP